MDKNTEYYRIFPNDISGKLEPLEALAWDRKKSQWMLINIASMGVTTPLSSGLAADVLRIWTEHGQIRIGV